MSQLIHVALRTDFRIFLRKAFSHINPNETLELYPYIEYLCHFAEAFADGSKRFLSINIPPRHLKTFIFCKALVAWMLGRNPTEKVMIFVGNEALAKNIPYEIREIMRAEWYTDAFSTRITVDHFQVADFRTTAGGACFTTTIGANFTGKGGNKLVIDDASDIQDAGDEFALQEVLEVFDPGITSRLNNPKTGGILNVGHRIDANDLGGYLLKQGAYESVVLPMVAPKSTTLRYGDKVWHREKGELLQIGSRSPQELDDLRTRTKSPDFDTLYQQNPTGELSEPITRKHFPAYYPHQRPPAGLVMSVDPGQEIGAQNSFSVIQLWCRKGGVHYLVDQYREQVEFRELLQACRKMRRMHRPVAVLIERTALGSALISEGKKRNWKGLVSIVPDGRSKSARLRSHLATILLKRIRLPLEAPWRDEFVRELVEFPNRPFTDQVDAMTQCLDWINDRPDLAPPGERGIVAVGLYSQRRGWP